MKIKEKSITEHINKDYKKFALHTIEKRGIPDFYDGLTNVQRFIIENTPLESTDTLNVIGKCKSDGYQHGDASLDGGINKLAREFDNADNIIIGKGFFGNPIKPEGASGRYTKVRLNKVFYDILKKNKELNKKIEDRYDSFKVEVPIGLVSHITGIAVAYSSVILPRKLSDIIDFLDGKISKVYPYMMNYTGNIVPSENSSGKNWIILPDVLLENRANKSTITIKDVSPTINFEDIIESLNRNIIAKHNIKVLNNTNNHIDISIEINLDKVPKDFQYKLYDEIKSLYTTKFTETINFIKDGKVVTYDSVEDYLKDFRNYVRYLKRDKLVYDIMVDEKEIDFLKSKIEYMIFMQEKQRNENEVSSFLSVYDKSICEKLDSIKLRNLTLEAINYTKENINKISSDLEKKKNKLNAENEKLQKNKYQMLGKLQF